MGLSIGIVGLPNVGKSTIFNALTREQNAETANYPFCTIEPNKAVVPVPDPRVEKLAELTSAEKAVHTTVEFLDIAGLVKGASKGEGLGNQFLSNIRETDAILQVVRCFDDDNVVHVCGSVDPRRDIEVIETELLLADFQMLEKRVNRARKQARGEKEIAAILPTLEAMLAHLDESKMVIDFEGHDSDPVKSLLKESQFMTDKRVIYCCNVDEAGLAEDNAYLSTVKEYAAKRGSDVVKICAKMEEDLNGMSNEERDEFLNEFGVKESGLDQIIHTGYHTLGLISFLTHNAKEARAWTVPGGCKAPQAAGTIHTDFERGFVRAQVVAFSALVENGSEAACREKGLIKTEGKEYVVQDGDVIEFLFNV